jgi:predicted MPP superfamily phosphohydrolase
MRFLIFFSILFSVSFSVQYYVIRRLSSIFDFHYSWKVFIVFFLLTANFVAVTMLSHRIWNIVVQLWYLVTVLYVGTIWILCFLLLCYSLVQRIAQWVVPIPQHVSQYIVIISASLLVLYSVFNARQLRIKTLEFSSKKLHETITIVQLSDLHLGAVHGKRFVERIVSKTNALQPDIVALTGDLLDGTGKISEATLRELHKFSAPVLFIAGNHDRFLPKEHVAALLRKTPFKVLQNEKYRYNDSLQIIGLDYLNRRPQGEVTPILDALSLNDHAFNLLLSHIPIDFPHTDGHAIDLLLSGHTHAGQIFPFYFVVKYFYPQIRGLYTSNDRHLYVSSGTGTWGPPLRLGTHSEITLIRLSPLWERGHPVRPSARAACESLGS